MSDLVLWATICFVIGLTLVLADVFIPSAGLLSVAGAALIIAGVVLLFMHSTVAGTIAAIVFVLLVPVGLALMIRFLPNIPMARRLRLATEPSKSSAGDLRARSLLGRTGQALTDLRPVGTCLIDHQRVQCLAQAGVIPRGQRIEVIGVSGFEVVVRAQEG